MSVLRTVLQLAIASLGIASIVATSGSGGWAPNPWTPPPGFAVPIVTITPSYASVQVGERVTFSATTNMSNPRYEWCRASRGASACVRMPQAVESSYTLAAAALEDDGARFAVTVTGNEGTRSSIYATLSVSPLPAVTFVDGSFEESGWVVTTAASPAQGGPSQEVSRSATGGNPGAYRKVAYAPPSGPGSARAFMVRSEATYSPTSQGAIHHVDFSMDCTKTSFADGYTITLLVEQGERKFAAGNLAERCNTNTNPNLQGFEPVLHPGLEATAFARVDGPACAPSQACPDFSASAAPLHFGLLTGADWPPARSAATLMIDNWKVVIWRR